MAPPINESLSDGVLTTLLPDKYDLATAKKMHFATSAIVGTIFFIVGMIGNTLSILVWRRDKMRSSTGTYLIGQAVADMGLLFFFFITDSVPMMDKSLHMSNSFGVFFSYIGYPIFFLFVVCSIWFTVGVTVDRYIQICWIAQAKEMCNVRRALTGLGIITALCFVINLPHFWTFEPVYGNSTTVSFKMTDYGAGEGSKHYEFWVHCIFLVLTPWLAIFIMNMLIIRQVYKLNKQMDSKRGAAGKEKAKKSEAQLTRLLLTVTFTFLVLIAMQCIIQCFFMLEDRRSAIVDEAFSIGKLGIVINSTINFFLYCLTGKRFRKELKIMLCGRIMKVREDSTSYSMSNTSSSVVSRTKSSASQMLSNKV